MIRIRASLPASTLTPSGTGREAFKVSVGDWVALKFYPESYNSTGLNEAFIELTMDKRTAFALYRTLEEQIS